MKYLSILPFFTLSKAQEETTTEPMIGRNLATARDMLTVLFENDNRFVEEGRQTANWVSKTLIKDYGCFCYSGGQKIVGSKFNYHGPGVDEVDNLCRELFFKQKCFALDTANGYYDQSVCETDNRFRWYMDDDNELQCGDRTDPSYYTRRPCKMNNCELEKAFVLKVAELYLSGSYVQNKDWKFMSDDDYKNSCQANGNGGKSAELKCCGNGIERRTYNTLMKECCEDGSVKIIGNCA